MPNVSDIRRPSPLSGRRIAVAFFFAFAVLLAIAPSSRAASVGVDGWHQTVYYVAAPGEANNVTISLASGQYTISDPGVNITAQSGCTLADSHHASCGSTGVKWIYVSAGDLNDIVALQAPTPAYVNCGTGTDSVTSAVTAGQYLWQMYCESVNAPPAASPPPAPAPPAPTPAAPLAIEGTVTTMTTGGSVPVSLGCSASATENCTGTLVLELPAKAASGRSALASRRGAPNILGKKEISLVKGRKRQVHVAMTSRARGLVKRKRRLQVRAVIKLKNGGTVSTSSQALTIRAPSKRH